MKGGKSMSHKQYEQLIENAIRDYKAAKQNNNKQKLEMAINDMENVFFCVCLRQVKGTENLRQTILEAKSSKAAINS